MFKKGGKNSNFAAAATDRLERMDILSGQNIESVNSIQDPPVFYIILLGVLPLYHSFLFVLTN